MINLSTGEIQIEHGNWGGENPFERKAVDVDEKEYVIPEGIAIILGNSGYHTFATLVLNPKNIVPGLLPIRSNVTQEMINVLKIFKEYKPAYRKEYLVGKEKIIEQAIQEGYLKKDGRGITLTISGKNSI